ncbi:MAG: hypothetical protein M3Y53_03950 [Thermoproteota archaeon]|nr:hypothetical protein [Thermoproteota archaeon]
MSIDKEIIGRDNETGLSFYQSIIFSNARIRVRSERDKGCRDIGIDGAA